MKHQTVPKLTLSQAIKLLEELENYSRTTTEKALSHINDGSGRKSQPSGAHGTISTRTKVWVTMILNGLKHLEELVNEQSGGNSLFPVGGGAKPSKFPTKSSN
jgi:hypothetical protein